MAVAALRRIATALEKSDISTAPALTSIAKDVRDMKPFAYDLSRIADALEKEEE